MVILRFMIDKNTFRDEGFSGINEAIERIDEIVKSRRSRGENIKIITSPGNIKCEKIYILAPSESGYKKIMSIGIKKESAK